MKNFEILAFLGPAINASSFDFIGNTSTAPQTLAFQEVL
jgi:hypothetical protein